MNNLNGLYIVTEWDFDKELVEMIIPDDLQERVSVLSAGGYSAALAMARSILSARHKSNAILVVDADTLDDHNIQEREDFIRSYMNRISADERFAILLQKPEIEAVFFEDKSALEHLTHRSFSDLEFRLAKDNPKDNLLDFLALPQKEKAQLLERAREDEEVKAELKNSKLSERLGTAIRRFLGTGK